MKNDVNKSAFAYAGLEIGAVSIKWVQKNEDGKSHVTMMRHEGNPSKKLEEIMEKSNVTDLNVVVLTGQSVNVSLPFRYRSEAECLEKALAFHKAEPDILLSLGGETFTLYGMKNGVIKNMMSSSKCAAGTGEFIIQQFQRMGFTPEEGIEAYARGKKVDLATRCSVYCKSDATHKLNKKECTKDDISRTLIHNLAVKVKGMIAQSKWASKVMVISGGLAKNQPFVDELRELMPDSKILVFAESPYLEAFGAMLYASGNGAGIEEKNRTNPLSVVGFEKPRLAPLTEYDDLLEYHVTDRSAQTLYREEPHILAVDAGSTTTKAVLFNARRKTVGAQCYLRTLGNPLTAAKECITELIRQAGGEPVSIIQAAATGSAREMVSVFLENSLSFNEILAHARAAREHVAQVETVFEIGSQDSKFISFQEGIPVDYAMNEGCSAGTGSFLEESVSVDMGIPFTEISTIALSSKTPTQFGERCAAFINTDLRSALQGGAKSEDVVAGLVYSIADNYTLRIVGPRTLGETIVFQGGVALNKAAALAMAAKTKRRVVVPPYPELMGCIGSALSALDMIDAGLIEKRFYTLSFLVQNQITQKGTFTCKSCSNSFEIQNLTVHNKTYPFGGLCSKFDHVRHRTEAKEGTDYVAMRNTLMFKEFGPVALPSPKGTVGFPMALTTYELFPLYAKLINEMGYQVVLSDFSKEGNTQVNAPICYPCEIVHGAVFDLLNKGVDYIFLPYTLDFEAPESFHNACVCPNTGNMPDLIRAAFPHAVPKLFSPRIGLSQDFLSTTVKDLVRVGKSMGLSKKIMVKAFQSARAHYERFREKLSQTSLELLDRIKDEPTVILAGRPYTVCSPHANLALPRKIASRGYHAVPADMIPPARSNNYAGIVWQFTIQVMNAIEYTKTHPHTQVCLLSSFSCIPDAPKVTHVYTFGNEEYFTEIMGHIFTRRGWNHRIVSQVTPKTMENGKRICSGRECLSFTSTSGAIYTDILENRPEDELTVYHGFYADAPCQSASWQSIWDIFGEKLGIDNALFMTYADVPNNYLGQGFSFASEIGEALVLADMLREARYTLRCLTEDDPAALDVFDRETATVTRSFLSKHPKRGKALARWAEMVSKIPLRHHKNDLPQVFIVEAGELELIFPPVADYFLSQGIIPKVMDFSSFIFIITIITYSRHVLERGKLSAKDQASIPSLMLSFFKTGMRFKEYMLANKSGVYCQLFDLIRKHYYTLASKSGLIHPFYTIPFTPSLLKRLRSPGTGT